MGKFSSWHVGIAAEAIAAALFARCGYNVSVQYGANQPEYDLIADDDGKKIAISVKGSKDGSWGLTQKYKKDRTYHEAIDMWLKAHHSDTIFCLVQFKGIELDEMPRVYLATPAEIAVELKKTARGRGDTILYEKHKWASHAYAAGTVDKIPDEWKFSKKRAEQLFDMIK